MTNGEEQFRPYAAPSNIIAVISRARTRNLPETINNEFLRIAGVPEVVFGRVMQALRFLNLVHKDGRPTESLEALAGSKEAEYHELLGTVVRDAYRAEFSLIDPGQDPQPAILDAFRPYQPRSQTSRMVMLFMSLCREAGIPILDVPRQRSMSSVKSRKLGMRASVTTMKATPRRERGMEETVGVSISPALQGLVRSLPAPGMPLSPERRKQWLEMAEVTLKFIYPDKVVTTEEQENAGSEEEKE